MRSSNPEQAQILLENIDETHLDDNERELYQYLTAYNLFINGDVPQANSLLITMARNNQNINIQVRTLGTLLSVYVSSNDWLNALNTVNRLETYLKPEYSLSNAEIERIKFYILNFYNNIGEYDLAKNIAINLLNTDISPRSRCLTSAELLNSQVKTTISSISAINFGKASRICAKVNELVVLQAINGYLAEFHLASNHPQKAVELLESNISSVEATKYQALIAGFYSLLAQSHLALKNYPIAESYAQILSDTEEQHHYHPSITSAYKVLATINEHSLNYEQAFYYYKKYSAAKQIQIDQNNAKLLAIQKAKIDVVEKNTQIALLDKENALLKTQALLDSESVQNKRLALALLSMVLVVFVLWTYKNRRNYLRMQHYAQIDELTGIANRHHFTQQANTAIKYCQRTDQPVSFIMFDLDFFKRVNDAYGHQTGDIALKIAADAAKLACRKNDIIGRLGGEEFGVLLPGCASHLAAFIAEKCRKAIEQADFSGCGHALNVTASFGISDSRACEYNFEKLFAGADYALYQSKELGRNRVVQYQQ
ncbi:MAG: diguanylate cyclase (GGDEF)-like protein [Paraglaciecola sp.]